LFHVLKQFASEGVRLVFIGEWQGYYDAITLENDFLGKMEAVMTNTGQAVDCGYNTLPSASLRPHQITQGMSNVTIACSSVLAPGPNGYPLYRCSPPWPPSTPLPCPWARSSRPGSSCPPIACTLS